MDFGELQNDEAFKQRINTLTAALDEIGRSAQAACQMPNYEKLSTEEKVKFDLFLSYSINSLFWAFCKLQAIDPADNGIKNEISRVRQAMMREKRLEEHKTIRPVLDKGAAGRFIRHGLWQPKKPTDDEKKNKQKKLPQKRKFNDDGDVIEITD